jgi:hypothetical protein
VTIGLEKSSKCIPCTPPYFKLLGNPYIYNLVSDVVFNQMKRLALITVPLLLAGIYFSMYKSERFEGSCVCYGAKLNNKCIGIQTTCYKLSPTLPPTKGSKKESMPKINLDGTILKIGDVFNFSPEDDCVADMKARLINIYNDGIFIEIFESQGADGNFYKKKELVQKTIKNRTCISAPPLCTDSLYEFCFTVDNNTNPAQYLYEIKGKSTMPHF